jgi:hypothetical protein
MMPGVLRLSTLSLVAVGALAGCPTVDLGDTPVTPPLCRPSLDGFKKVGGIWDTAIDPPDASKSCVAREGCHAQATGRSALRLTAKPRDQMTDADWSQNLDVIARFLNCASPASSAFITKPEAGIDSHLGGDLWTCTGSCEPITTVEEWIAEH